MRNKNAESQATRTDALWPKCGTRIRMRNPLRFRTKAADETSISGPRLRNMSGGPLGSSATSERRHGQALARFRATPGKQRDNPGTSLRHDCTRNFGQPGQTLDQLRITAKNRGRPEGSTALPTVLGTSGNLYKSRITTGLHSEKPEQPATSHSCRAGEGSQIGADRPAEPGNSGQSGANSDVNPETTPENPGSESKRRGPNSGQGPLKRFRRRFTPNLR